MDDRGGAARTDPAGAGVRREGHTPGLSGDSDSAQPGGDARLAPGRKPARRWRTPLGVGLGFSGILHLVAIVLYSFSVVPALPDVRMSAPDTESAPVAGTRIVNVIPVDGEVEVAEPTPEEEEPQQEPGEVVAPPTVEPGPPAEPSERARTAGEVLRPHAEDSIVLREVDPELTRLTDAERAQLRMNWMVNEWNELSDAERRRAEEALDWTHTDAEGNKWGVSPGKLHLGSVTLPLPLNFAVPEGRDPAADRMRADLREIEEQAARGRVWENWKRRAEEIRKRKDRERAEQLGGVRADTTGTGR